MNIQLAAATLLLAGTSYADGPRLSANPYDPNSTSNPVGIYGSPNSPVSANNPYGQGVPLAAPRAEPQAAEPTINVWATRAPAQSYDLSGLDRLDWENGHPVAREAPKQADVDRRNESLRELQAEEATEKPKEDIFDALSTIRKEAAKKK